MADIATLGLVIRRDQVIATDQALDQMASTAEKTEKRTTSSSAKVTQALLKEAQTVSRIQTVQSQVAQVKAVQDATRATEAVNQAQRVTAAIQKVAQVETFVARESQKAATEVKKLGDAKRQTAADTLTLESAGKKLLQVFAGYKLVQMAREAIGLGARYETLGVVLNVVGNNAGYSAEQMAQFQADLQKTGISAIGAREALTRMVQAQLDLSKSSELARVAQNAAVIGGTNSTDAFQRLVYGIQSAQVEILRTVGITVSFEAGYKAMAKQLGVSVASLSEAEKMQSRYNQVLQSGEQINKVYEASLGTASKQLGSATRYLEDAETKASKAFQPAYTAMVFAYADALKWTGENAGQLGAVLGGLGVTVGILGGLWFAYANYAKLAAAWNAVLAAGQTISAFISLAKTVRSVADAMALLQIVGKGAAGAVVVIGAMVAGFFAYKQILEQVNAETKKWEDNINAVGNSGGPTGPSEEELKRLKERANFLKEFNASNQERVRIAQQEYDLAGLSGDAAEKLRVEHEAINDLARARLTLNNDDYDTFKRFIEIEKTWKLATIDRIAIQREANKQREAAAEKQIQDAKEHERVLDNLFRSLQDTVSGFLNDVFTRSVRTFEDITTRIKNLFLKVIADILAANVMRKLAGVFAGMMGTASVVGAQGVGLNGLGAQMGREVIGGGLAGLGVGYGIGSMTTDRGLGGLGGAAGGAAAGFAIGGPVGAAIGGITGFIGGILGSGKAAREAEKELRRMREALTLSMAAVRAEVNGTATALSESILKAQTDFKTLRQQTEDAYKVGAFESLSDKGQAKVAERTRLLKELDGLEAKRLQQLKDEYTVKQTQLQQDYGVRSLRAQGQTQAADDMAFVLTQERELAQLRKDNADTATIAALQQAQAAEKAAYATARYAAVIESLTAFSQSLKLDSSLSTLSPMQQMMESQRQYESILAQARLGDQAAAGNLPSAARAFLEASRGVNASSSAYASDYNRVQSDTAGLTSIFESQRNVQTDMLTELKTSVAVLQAGFKEVATKLDTVGQKIDDSATATKRGLEGAKLK